MERRRGSRTEDGSEIIEARWDDVKKSQRSSWRWRWNTVEEYDRHLWRTRRDWVGSTIPDCDQNMFDDCDLKEIRTQTWRILTWNYLILYCHICQNTRHENVSNDERIYVFKRSERCPRDLPDVHNRVILRYARPKSGNIQSISETDVKTDDFHESQMRSYGRESIICHVTTKINCSSERVTDRLFRFRSKDLLRHTRPSLKRLLDSDKNNGFNFSREVMLSPCLIRTRLMKEQWRRGEDAQKGVRSESCKLHSTEDWAYSTSRLDTQWSCQIQSRETHTSDESSVSDVDDAVKKVHKNKSTFFEELRFESEDDASEGACSIEIKVGPSHVCISIYTKR